MRLLLQTISSLHLLQVVASFFMTCLTVGFTGLYATLVCIACSQLEKLRASLLDIRQTHVTAQQDCGTQADQQDAQGQDPASEERFRHMQTQLNNCIRHHQQIKRFNINSIETHALFRARHDWMYLHWIVRFQIHGSNWRRNESPAVWNISNYVGRDVFRRFLRNNGKVLSHK
jgi:hypothetical protein